MNVMSVDLALNRAGLVGTFEGSGDPVAILRDLDVLNNGLTVLDVGGVNRPVALNVVWRLLSQQRWAEHQRQESNANQGCNRFVSFHDILHELWGTR